MNLQQSINALIDEIEAILSKGGGRFTADDIEALENVLKKLKTLRKTRDVDKLLIVDIICQLLKFFLSHEVLEAIKKTIKM